MLGYVSFNRKNNRAIWLAGPNVWSLDFSQNITLTLDSLQHDFYAS